MSGLVGESGRPARLLVVVAHPDDETFGCGSLILHAVASGAQVVVCCATRGEVGEPAPGSGITQDQLGEVREQELSDAARLLGASGVELLGLVDSGLAGPPSPDTLMGAPFDDVVDRVAAVIEKTEADVLLTLDGGDGHRDHARIRDAALAAAARPGSPVRQVYLQCVPRTWIQEWLEEQRRTNPDSPYLDLGDLGTPEELITSVVDTTDHLAARERAIAAHASQVSPFAMLPEDVRRRILTTDHLRRVVPPWPAGEPATDGFDLTAGLS
jgi:LmbE family N-acetylglucosaminyl deacetylase